MIVIGSGPAGQRAAIQAAKLGKHVAIIERKTALGGAGANTGTIPSKTLREAVLHLSGFRERSLYGASYTVKEKITIDDLLFRADHVIRHDIDVTRHQLLRNNVEIITATAKFVDANNILIDFVNKHGSDQLSAAFVVIAAGTRVAKPDGIPFDGQTVFTSDDILRLDYIPQSLTVIGGGVIGCEYACMFATLGVRVTLVDKHDSLLSFVDREIVDALVYHMRQQRVTFRLCESVKTIEPFDTTRGKQVRITLDSGKEIVTDKALYSIGRTGATDSLDLAAVGLKPDSRGRLKVNKHYQTDVSNVYAVGDVIGFPSLASTSMEQGRLAACHAFQIETNSVPELFPYGIYAIPEISTCGPNEEELTRDGVPYEVGKAHYREIARGQIIGDQIGTLKLLFHRETHKLLGVHIIGEGASELIHIGQTVMAFNGKVDYFINTVFNYPTLAECYKTAAFDGLNRIH
jgi:NAD(P) transhydrogenase